MCDGGNKFGAAALGAGSGRGAAAADNQPRDPAITVADVVGRHQQVAVATTGWGRERKQALRLADPGRQPVERTRALPPVIALRVDESHDVAVVVADGFIRAAREDPFGGRIDT